MGRRRNDSQSAAESPPLESEETLLRRLELLEASDKKKSRTDPFTTDELEPLEGVKFDFSEKPVDPELVRRLAAIGCDDEEIAEALDSKAQRIRELYGSYLRQGRAQGRTALRRKQWQMAMRGNTQMLVHLGKNVLGQSDNVNVNHSGVIEVEEVDPREKLAALMAKAAARLNGLNPSNEIMAPAVPRLVESGPDDDDF